MNILLTDDDNLILQEVKEILERAAPEIEKIYIATCIADAQEVLRTVSVQIMLCDIEMPGGSGLDLLAWVREQSLSVQCIFLTNYADFSYARQAIRLNSLEYLLKPIEEEQLCRTVRCAMERVEKERQDERARRYWLDTGKEAKDNFWQRKFLGNVTQGEEMLRRLGYGEQDLYIFASLKAISLSTVEELWGTDMFEYVLKNVLFELLDTFCFRVESVFCIVEGIWFMVCRFSGMAAPDTGVVEEAMEQVKTVCREKIHFETICGVGMICGEEGLQKQFTEIREMMENALEDDGKIRHLEDYKPVPCAYVTPDVSIWESLLKEGQKEQLRTDIHDYVACRVAGSASWQGAQAFRQDVTQMFYSFLRSAGIKAHKVFTGRQAEILYQRACNSMQDMCLYCDFMLDQVFWHKERLEQPASIMRTVLQYVDEHYCEDITRNDLTDLVYVSPDYLSRTFKKETGRSLAQYMLEKRVEKAKKLLQSDMSVKNVALQTGYSNFSYFSKVFRDMEGMSPMEYREQIRKERNGNDDGNQNRR